MKVLVLGAGVIGVTTAYVLARRGCEVVIADREATAARGTSYANGGQLSYDYRTPIANPSVLLQLPKILAGLDPAFRIHPSTHIDFYRWGLQFLWQCRPQASRRSAEVMQSLGQMARTKLRSIVAETGLHFDYKQDAGKLYLYSSEPQWQRAAPDKNSQALKMDQVYLQCPGLNQSLPFIKGILYPHDDVGDCHQFSQNLLEYCVEYQRVTFLPNCCARSFSVAKNSVQGVNTTQGLLQADAYVLALGAQSAPLMKSIGTYLPIYPMKGYSVTVPATDRYPQVSVTDTQTKTVYCRLGSRLRIAGYAEFSGYTTQIDTNRITQLLDNARRLLPLAGDYDRVLEQWCGLRPATPNSLPLVGPSAYENLYLNTGHGMLGWTYAAATASLLEDALFENKYWKY